MNRLIVFVFCLIFAQLAGCATPESEIASAHPHSKQQIMSISSFTLTYYRRGDANALRVVSRDKKEALYWPECLILSHPASSEPGTLTVLYPDSTYSQPWQIAGIRTSEPGNTVYLIPDRLSEEMRSGRFPELRINQISSYTPDRLIIASTDCDLVFDERQWSDTFSLSSKQAWSVANLGQPQGHDRVH